MTVNVNTARRDALDFLIKIHGSQTALAIVLKHSTLTQSILSAIQREKRLLHQLEARDIERIMGIPDGWMDRNNWVREGWQIAKDYQTLGAKEKAIANRLLAFVLDRTSE
jgi:hypothetical protein